MRTVARFLAGYLAECLDSRNLTLNSSPISILNSFHLIQKRWAQKGWVPSCPSGPWARLFSSQLQKVSSLLGRAWNFKVWNFLSILPCKGSRKGLPRWPDSEVEHANLIQPQQAVVLCCFVSSSRKKLFSAPIKVMKRAKSARRSRSSRRKLWDH